MSLQPPPPSISKTARALAAVEAELKQRGPLTALTKGTIFLRLSKREAELAAAKKNSARAPGTARPAAAGLARPAPIAAKAPAAAPVQPTPNSARSAVEASDAQLWEFFQKADVHDSNILASDPAAYQRIKNESRRRLTR